MKPIDLTGKRFGILTVLRLIAERDKHGKRVWLCKCACGRKKRIVGESLTQGKTKSCGECLDHPGGGTPADTSWHDDLIAAIESGSAATEACRKVGIANETARLHRLHDSEFAKEWERVTPKERYPEYPGFVYVKDACRKLRCTEGCLFNLAWKKNEPIEKKAGKGKGGRMCRRSYVSQEFVDRCKEERKKIAGDSLSVRAAADALGISRRKVAHLIKNGKIKARKTRFAVSGRRRGKAYISIKRGLVISKEELERFQEQQMEHEADKPQPRVDEQGIVWLPRSLARAMKIESWVLTYYSDNPCPYLDGRKLEANLFDGLLHFKKKELETLALALRRRKFKDGRLLPVGEAFKIGRDTWYHGSLALKKFGIRLRGRQNYRNTVWLLDGRSNGGHGSKPLRRRPITWQKIPNPWASRPKEIVVYHEKDLKEIAARIKDETRSGTFFPPLIMNSHAEFIPAEKLVAPMASASSIVTGSHQRERVRQVVVVDELTPNALSQLGIGTVPDANYKGLNRVIFEVMRLKDWMQENEFIQQVWGIDSATTSAMKQAIHRFNNIPDTPFRLSQEDGKILKIK